MASLVRHIVRVDGRITPGERDSLHDIAAELGEDEFWEILQSKEETLPFKQCVAAVDRTETQELIFDVVMTVAMVGSMDQGETTLLEKLAEGWGIEIQHEEPPEHHDDDDEPEPADDDEPEPADESEESAE